jgi:hypothetical protein
MKSQYELQSWANKIGTKKYQELTKLYQQELNRRMIAIGDYVLATKYSDGDPCDHFCVGFVKEIITTHSPHRYDVVDSDGKSFRGNGFRKASKITQQEGEILVNMFPIIGDKPGRSIWWHLRQIRKEINKPNNN